MSDAKAALKAASEKDTGAGVGQVYLLGLTIVIGGQYILWNAGLEAGFYTFLFCTLFLGCGYICLSLCLSEMIGILPFGGGAYGFARLTLGPTFGYLIGCCESIESILYVTAALVPFGRLISSIFNISSVYEPLWWFMFYVSAMGIHCSGNTAFWAFNCILGVVVTALVLVYCFGSIPNIDFPHYVTHQNHYLTQDRGMEVRIFEMMKCLPLAGWWYVGVEGLPLVCSQARHATTTVPRAIMLCMVTILLTAVGILLCGSSQFPGVYHLASGDNNLDIFLLNYGFSEMFHISRRFAGILSIPAIYATSYGFMFIYGTQMCAMAKSGLFPKALATTLGPTGAPYVALLSGSTIGFLILIVLHFTDPSLMNHLFNISMLGSFFVYMSTFTSFIIFKTKYTTLTRNFVNPLGVYSAYFGVFVFSVAFIAICVFQEDNHTALAAFIVLIGLFVVYYWRVAKKRQYYSPDEQGILLITYIIKGNMLKKRRRSSMGQSNTPVATRSQVNTPVPQGKEVPTPVLDYRSTPPVAVPDTLKEEDGVVPFSSDEVDAMEKGEASATVSASASVTTSAAAVSKKTTMRRGDTFDPAEAADTVGELKHLYGGGLAGVGRSRSNSNDEEDSFHGNSISVSTQIKQLSLSSLLFAARRKSAQERAQEHWQQAKGAVVQTRNKPAPARLSTLIHKRQAPSHLSAAAAAAGPMKYREMLAAKASNDSHNRSRSRNSHDGQPNHHSGDSKSQDESEEVELNRIEYQRTHDPTMLMPEHDETSMNRNTGRRGSGSVHNPFLGGGQRNISHWFAASRRVGDASTMGGWYLSTRSSGSSSNSAGSMSRRMISRLNSSLSSVNLMSHMDKVVTAHHESVVQNVINILPSKSSVDFDGVVTAIVNRMLQEKDLDQEAFDNFLDSLGDTEEARVIAVRYQEELARRGRVMVKPSPKAAAAAAAVAAAEATREAANLAALSDESI